MSEGNRKPTRQFVEIGDAHVATESGSDTGDNLQSQLLDRKSSSSEIDRIINAIVAPLATQLEMLIQSVWGVGERSSNRSIEGNGMWRPNDRDCRFNVATPAAVLNFQLFET